MRGLEPRRAIIRPRQCGDAVKVGGDGAEIFSPVARVPFKPRRGGLILKFSYRGYLTTVQPRAANLDRGVTLALVSAGGSCPSGRIVQTGSSPGCGL